MQCHVHRARQTGPSARRRAPGRPQPTKRPLPQVTLVLRRCVKRGRLGCARGRTGSSEACFRTSYRLPRWQNSMMMSGGLQQTPAPRSAAASVRAGRHGGWELNKAVPMGAAACERCDNLSGASMRADGGAPMNMTMLGCRSDAIMAASAFTALSSAAALASEASLPAART